MSSARAQTLTAVDHRNITLKNAIDMAFWDSCPRDHHTRVACTMGYYHWRWKTGNWYEQIAKALRSILNELCINRQHETLLEMERQHILCRSLLLNIIWLAQWTVKMNKILLCDWLLERVRLCFLTQSGQPAVSRKEDFPEIHTINPLLTKLFGQESSILASFLYILLMDLNSAYQWTRKIKNSAATQPPWPRS